MPECHFQPHKLCLLATYMHKYLTILKPSQQHQYRIYSETYLSPNLMNVSWKKMVLAVVRTHNYL